MACAMRLIRKNAEMVLDVKDWRVDFETEDGLVEAVRGVSFSVAAGKCLAIVGESGSGKSQLCQTLFGLAATNAILSGTALFDGSPISATRNILGRDVAFIFQDPLTSLTPHMTIGAQMVEALNAHGKVATPSARARCLELLKTCRIDNPELRFRQYPHELSGGMRQRVMIAQAIAHRPKLLIADEPTTALDVTVQADVLDLLADLRSEFGMALILITHDMGVAARLADDVMVLQKGKSVEQGSAEKLFSAPSEAYTQELLAAKKPIPVSVPKDKAASTDALLMTVDHVSVSYKIAGPFFGVKSQAILYDISFSALHGECIAVVGESGSGKSTLARAVAGLLPVDRGEIILSGSKVQGINPSIVQTVFQDPLAALNPRQTVGASVREALDILAPELDVAERSARARQVFDQVHLPQEFYDRYPHELSGGQCQRVCIARALLPNPELLICDEAISALDATTAVHILRELSALKHSLGLSILFITHDLHAAAQIADHVLVLQKGRIVEFGPATRIFANPEHEYTKALFNSTLVADPIEMARRTALRRS
jgi:peptide/nickel transport system ATP-binding protein